MKGFYYIKKGPDIMRAIQVNLKQEVTRYDAMTIMKWMENHEITRYLNEATNISFKLKEAVDRVNMHIMTHLFNNEGSFYIIHDDNHNPLGFLKLARKHKEVEMVIVIGEQKLWGQGIGKSSIKRGLDIAFFQWRLPRVIAKIKSNNIRSIKAFENLGFVLEYEHTNTLVYSLSMDDYIKRLV
jgi:RimJ/RimL family protein N-acetyltransferase